MRLYSKETVVHGFALSRLAEQDSVYRELIAQIPVLQVGTEQHVRTVAKADPRLFGALGILTTCEAGC